MKAITNNYTIKDSDFIIVCNSSSDISLYLKSASGKEDMFYIKNLGTGNVTITANSPDLIDGESTKVIAQYESCLLLDYDLNVWIVI